MKITFILPGTGRFPVGGLKIVYEYANRLAERGHSVSLVHSPSLDYHASIQSRVVSFTQYCKRHLRKDFGPRTWFELHSNVNLIFAPSLASRYVPVGDVVIATAWQTAEWVAEYPLSRGERFYFLQHQETWSGPEARVMNTWKLPLKKIAISRWLQQLAADFGEEATYIPNGLDFSAFGLDQPVEQRDSLQVLMLYHREDWKGSADGLKALETVRLSFPDLQVHLYGVSERTPDIPNWVSYHRLPKGQRLRELYNQAAIFVAPSWAEGWGLPGSEAMMCGAAVVATDIGGHREFAIQDDTALVVPARDPDALAKQILRLCIDQQLRVRIARKGYANIQQFTWERAVNSFEAELSDHVSPVR